MVERSSLQSYIDDNLQDIEESCYSFVCVSKQGDCVIPENVCIRFIDCNISNIVSQGNNVLNFDNCTFTGNRSSFTNSVVNINNSPMISSKLELNNSKLYIADCKAVSNTILLNKNSYCKSHTNLYSSTEVDSVFIISDGSKVESYKDEFQNFNGPLFNVKNKSYMKISSPIFSTVGSLCTVDTLSELELYELNYFTGQPSKYLATVTNKSKLKLHTISDLIISKATAITLIDSSCFLNNITKIFTEKTFIDSNNSTIDIINADYIYNASDDLFKCTNSVLNLYDIDKIEAKQGNCFNLIGTDLVYINNYKTAVLTSTSGSVITSQNSSLNIQPKLYLNNFSSISASRSPAFLIKTTSLKLTNISQIVSIDRVISASNKSTVILSDIQEIVSYGNTCIYLEDQTKAFIYYITKLSGYDNVVFCSDGIVYIKSVDDLISLNIGVSLLNDSSLFLDNIKNLYGSNIGIKAANTQGGKVEIKNNCNITGEAEAAVHALCDITIDGGTLTSSQNAFVANNNICNLSNITKIDKNIKTELSVLTITNCHNVVGVLNTTASVVATNNCNMENLDCFNKSVITNNNSTYSKDVTIRGSILTNLLSNLVSISKANNSVIQTYLSSITGEVVLEQSSLFNLGSAINSIDLQDRSTLIGGTFSTATPGTIKTPKDGNFINPAGAFIVGEGELALSSSVAVLLRTALFEGKIRDNISLKIDATAADISKKCEIVVGPSSITVDPSLILLKATSVKATNLS